MMYCCAVVCAVPVQGAGIFCDVPPPTNLIPGVLWDCPAIQLAVGDEGVIQMGDVCTGICVTGKANPAQPPRATCVNAQTSDPNEGILIASGGCINPPVPAGMLVPARSRHVLRICINRSMMLADY